MLDRDTIKQITLVFGVLYLIVGILGFIPGITTDAPDTAGIPGGGLLMGIFGINLVHNVSHLLFGAIAIWGGATTARNAVMANRILFVIFLVVLVANFIPPLGDLFMLNTADFFLHLVSAALTGYLGFVAARNTSPLERA